MDIIQLTSIVLVMILLFLGFKILEQKWSYKISKPFAWEDAVKNGLVSDNLLQLEKYYHDRVRFYTFWLQIARLEKDQVKGAFAELGVYQGETANIIHEMAPQRDLHLFDTFEGFSDKDLSVEVKNNAKYSVSNFSDTTLEKVKNYIDGNENIYFHAGYFPESADGIEVKRYALVHLDADLFQPTLSGLQYFYPKLAAGGVIIVHDYNHTWDGVRKAIDEFSITIPESFMPIADWQGSVILVRNSKLKSQ